MKAGGDLDFCQMLIKIGDGKEQYFPDIGSYKVKAYSEIILPTTSISDLSKYVFAN